VAIALFPRSVMSRATLGLSVLLILSGSSLAAERLTEEQLARVVLYPPIPAVRAVCNFSDCIPPSRLPEFERPHIPLPTVMPGTLIPRSPPAPAHAVGLVR
jgi:hypothetical protein